MSLLRKDPRAKRLGIPGGTWSTAPRPVPGRAGETAAPAQPGKPVREPGARGQRPDAAAALAAGTRRGCRRGAAEIGRAHV